MSEGRYKAWTRARYGDPELAAHAARMWRQRGHAGTTPLDGVVVYETEDGALLEQWTIDDHTETVRTVKPCPLMGVAEQAVKRQFRQVSWGWLMGRART